MENMTSSLEEYLKTTYILYKKNSQIRVTDIANELNCTKSSVNRAIKILAKQGYINYETYGNITLTKLGVNKALEIVRRNEIIKAFLIQVLDVDEKVASK